MEEGFKKLLTWKKTYELALAVYKMTECLPKHELYTLVSQIRRAAISVSANIAEGYERQHRKEYLQFLMIAKGSLGELETYLSFAKDLGYITADEYEMLDAKRREAGRLLKGLTNSLQSLSLPHDP